MIEVNPGYFAWRKFCKTEDAVWRSHGKAEVCLAKELGGWFVGIWCWDLRDVGVYWWLLIFTSLVLELRDIMSKESDRKRGVLTALNTSLLLR